MKVVDLEKLWNFLVYSVFIWIYLGPQIVILIPDEYRIIRIGIIYRHKIFLVQWLEEGTCEAKVVGSNPTSCDRYFSENFFAECFLACGKVFAECLTKDTWQRALCQPIIYNIFFGECYTQQSFCRKVFGLCQSC